MALTGFPEKIKVTLGSLWTGGGNGLNSGQSLILTEVGGYWTEDGTNTADSTNNRLKTRAFQPSGGWQYHTVYGCSDAATDAFDAICVIGGRTASPTNYNFLDLWNVADKSSTIGASNYIFKVNHEAFKAQSLNSSNNISLSTFTAPGQGPVVLSQFTGIYSTMEEYVESRAPDKSTYRYG